MQETFKKIFTDARAAMFEVNSLRKALAYEVEKELIDDEP